MAEEDEYSSTARALAAHVEDDAEDTILPVRHHRAASPIWSRRSVDSQRPSQPRPKWLRQATKLQARGVKLWLAFTPLQRAGIIILNIVLLVFLILFLIYNERIFHYLGPAAKRYREMPGGWLILWFATFLVSFPPMIGYSTLVTIAGFVFGMYGWFIMASATVIGSTCGFVASRTLFRNYVERMTEKNKQFAALSLVLKHDGLKLLCMIRLCPLPYSFANGAISTIPTVTWPNFMLATAIASPKLLLHIFIGRQLGMLAEDAKMDTKTKIVSYISIAVGITLGIGTGYIIYVRTKARAKVLEAEEAAAATGGRRSGEARRGGSGEYADDSDEEEAVNILRRGDDISLHEAYADDDVERGYRDDFTDDADALERDVFDVGDGETDEEDAGQKNDR